MKSSTFRTLMLTAVCLPVLASGEASASLRFSVGFGTVFGGCHRHHIWCDDWYWHRHWDPYPYWHSYPCWPGCCTPTVGVWLHSWPTVVAAAPVVENERQVTVEEHTGDRRSICVTNTGRTDGISRHRQGELLKALRIGGPEDRMRSARQLAEHSCDARVRAALERALLSDRDAEVRKAVAQSLGKSGDDRVIPALRRAYKEDADRAVQQAAYRSIIMIVGY